MNSFIATLPWTVPAPIGIVVGTGFAPLSFIFVALSLIVDVLIWLPFFRVYDNSVYAKEQTEKLATKKKNKVKLEKNKDRQQAPKTLTKETNVMVICAGGGTSGILAKALNKLASEKHIPMHAVARAYGQHMDVIDDMDLIILAPQMDSMKANLAEVAKSVGSKLVTTTGRQYIELTQNKDKALKFVLNALG